MLRSSGGLREEYSKPWMYFCFQFSKLKRRLFQLNVVCNLKYNLFLSYSVKQKFIRLD